MILVCENCKNFSPTFDNWGLCIKLEGYISGLTTGEHCHYFAIVRK